MGRDAGSRREVGDGGSRVKKPTLCMKVDQPKP